MVTRVPVDEPSDGFIDIFHAKLLHGSDQLKINFSRMPFHREFQ